jgi:hypothetical protein
MTIWTRSLAPSLASRRATWALAAAALIDRQSAISLLDRPRPTSSSTSRSRTVSPRAGARTGRARARRAVGLLQKHAGEAGDEAPGDTGRDERVACGGDTDRGQDVVQGHVFDQEPAGAGPQRAVDVLVGVEGGEDDYPRRCMRSHGYPDWPDPKLTGHGFRVPFGFDTSSPQFQAAARTCGLPPGA